MTESLTAKGRETRERIVQVAAHLMHVQGVSATSLEDVLEVAEAGKGQFYHYFESRHALEEAVLQYHVESQPESQSPGDVLRSWEEVEGWFEAAYNLYEMTGFRGGCPLGSMAAEVADRDEELRLKLDAAFAAKGAHLASGFAELQRSGTLAGSVDAGELAEFVVAAIQGGLMLARVRRDGAPLRAAMDHALTHIGSFRTAS